MLDACNSGRFRGGPRGLTPPPPPPAILGKKEETSEGEKLTGQVNESPHPPPTPFLAQGLDLPLCN